MSNQLLFKKEYTSENQKYISVVEYLVYKHDNNNELVLKLMNIGTEKLKDFQLLIHELDANGVEIGTSFYTCRNEVLAPNTLCVPKTSATVSKSCKDIKVEVIFAVYETFLYEGKRETKLTSGNKNLSTKKLGAVSNTRNIKRPIFATIFAVILAAVIMICIGVAIDEFRYSGSSFYYDGLYYRFTYENGERGLEVTGAQYGTNISIPSYLEEYRVISIADSAFQYSGVQTVHINGDVVIGDYAFSNCTSLQYVSMNNVTKIGRYAFEYCSSLVSVECYNLSAVENHAFSRCTALNSFTAKNDYKTLSLGSYVFYNCRSLREVTLEQHVLTTGISAVFESCPNIEYLSINEFSGSRIRSLFYSESDTYSIKELHIKELFQVNNELCRNMRNLEKITIDELSSSTIGKYAFAGCNKLTEINLPNNIDITTIGEYAFYGTNIAKFDFDDVTSVGDYAFAECRNLRSVVIPSGLYRLSTSMFEGCTSLSSVTLPSTIDRIPSSTFKNCSSLTSIKIPSSVSYIGNNAFDGCSKLKTIELSSNLESIGTQAFKGCSALTDIVIPKYVTTISTDTFMNCTKLARVQFNGNVTQINDQAFKGCTSLASITLPKTLTSIGKSAFEGCTSLTSLEIPNSVLSLRENLLAGCTSLEVLTTPFIGSSIYSYEKLSYLLGSEIVNSILEVNVTTASSIASYCFENCESLQKVTLNDNITSIPEGAFQNAIKLREFSMPAYTHSIGYYAFYNCRSLNEIKIPSTLSTINSYAFENCRKLYEVYNYSNLNIVRNSTSYGYVARYALAVYTNALQEKIDIQVIDDYKFAYVDGEYHLLEYLGTETELKLPINFNFKSITVYSYVIHSLAFENSAIEKIVIPEGVYSIQTEAFLNCENLESVSLPSTINTYYSIENSAFAGCNKIYEVYDLGYLGIQPGDSYSHGGIGANLLVVHDSASDYPLIKYESDGIEYRLTASQVWLLDGSDATGEVSIPSSFTYRYNNTTKYVSNCIIKEYAFSSNYSITSLSLSSSVTTVEPYAFYDCNSLEDVTVSMYLTEIDNYAFAYCSSLETLTIPTNGYLTTIGYSAFYGNSNLKEITLPSKLTSIGSDAFWGCNSLLLVYNYSSLSITEQSTSNGYVGYYAFYVLKNTTSFTHFTSGDFTFGRKNNVWYIYDYTGSDGGILKLPSSASGSSYSVSSYYTWYDFTNHYFEGVVIPTSVKGQENNSLSFDYYTYTTIYYEGTQNQWYSSSLSWISPYSLRFYTDCVHDNSSWTYKNGVVSTDIPYQTTTVITQSTCKVEGKERVSCSECNYVYYTNSLPLAEHKFNSENKCSVCSKVRTIVTEDIFNSSYFTNDYYNPFVYNENGEIRSTNSAHNSSGKLQFKVSYSSQIRLDFDFKVSSEYSDYMVISLNGSQVYTAYGNNTSDHFSITLSRGDVLTITYKKDGSVTSLEDCIILSNMYFVIEK